MVISHMYNPPAIDPMANHGSHGNLLEVTVVGCNKLKDKEWISRQDPYVCVEYGSNISRTRVCTDGGNNPTFQEKFVYSLIDGLRELNITVWNSNTLTYDDFIGSGKVQLAKVLSDGFDDSSWPLQTKTGRYAGEVRLIMRYSNAKNPANGYAPSPTQSIVPVGNLHSVTVEDIEWTSRQDPWQVPYVCLEYGSYRSRTSSFRTDGRKSPKFQEKFVYSLIEGLRELNITVWNRNTPTHDDFIGSGKVQLDKALSDGFDDSSWPLFTKTGRYAGEVRLIMRCSNANIPENSYTPSAPSYIAPSAPPVSMYSTLLPPVAPVA